MHLGMIGLGRLGANMAWRLIKADHKDVVSDVQAQTVKDFDGDLCDQKRNACEKQI